MNAFIRGVDLLANQRLPAAVIMCTNRLGALDPAVRRRAADILTFGRPDADQRRAVFSRALDGLGWSDANVEAMVNATGPAQGRGYGFTFSDITQRLLPSVVLDAYPASAIDPRRAASIAEDMAPTPPFIEASA